LAWQIEFDESAKKELAKLDRQVARRLIDFLRNRVLNLRDPRSIGQACHLHIRRSTPFASTVDVTLLTRPRLSGWSVSVLFQNTPIDLPRAIAAPLEIVDCDPIYTTRIAHLNCLPDVVTSFDRNLETHTCWAVHHRVGDTHHVHKVACRNEHFLNVLRGEAKRTVSVVSGESRQLALNHRTHCRSFIWLHRI